MINNKEHINNIFNKVNNRKQKRKKLIKLYSSTVILFCMITFLTYVGINNFKTKNLITSENKPNMLYFNKDFVVTVDSIPLIMYNDNIYKYDGSISCQKESIKSLLDKYLGNASGSLTEKDESDKIFASINAAGKIYSVNGYNIEFRICITDEQNSYIQFYDNIDKDNLVTGNDLFGKNLFLKDKYEEVLYQSHKCFMSMQNDKYPLILNRGDIDKFIDALYESSFITMSVKEQEENLPNYDTEGDKIGHLYFNMNDGTSIKITLYEKGYIYYNDLNKFLYVENEIFDKVFKSITQN